ncbi:hypothetical protein UlMin_020060 [Ulmus minor]
MVGGCSIYGLWLWLVTFGGFGGFSGQSTAAHSSSSTSSSTTTSTTLRSPTTRTRTTSSTSPPSLSSKTTTTRPPQPQPAQPNLPALIFNAVDQVINNFIEPPLRPSVNPKHVLSHNFAPVPDELPPTDSTLCSRYVSTYKYLVERQAGHPLFPNVFSGFNGLTASAARGALTAARVFAGQYNPINGIGLANTSLAYFANRLYALGESDLPYQLRFTPNGDIQTIGRDDFNGNLSMSMTAHPKIDPGTGEAFAFRYGPIPPFLTYFRFNAKGEKQPDVPIFSMNRPSLLHDFAITKKYAIFADIQIGMNPMELIGGGSPVGSDASKVPKLGLIPRYAKDESEMRWFEVPGFNIMHAINAWDEEDAVVMVAPNILSIEHTMERMELVHALVEKVRIDLKTGIVSRQPLSAGNLDFAVINPAYTARKNKYVYAAVGEPMPKIAGVVKLDVSRGGGECTVGRRMFGEGCYGGEPFFVGKENGEEEDDGYVVSYVHNERSRESRFIVMDAKSPELEIVAAVKLPRRVPYGFHGLFVSERDIQNTML